MELSNFLYGNIYLYHMNNNFINTNIENTNIYVDLSDEEFLSIVNTFITYQHSLHNQNMQLNDYKILIIKMNNYFL